MVPLILVARARRDLPETAPPGRTPRVSLRSLRRTWLVGASLLAFLFAVFATAVTSLASLLVFDGWGWELSDLRPHYLLVAVSGFFVAGRLMDRWGRRPAAVMFFSGSTVAGSLAFTAGSTTGRVLGMSLVIFFLTGSAPCAAAYATELFPVGARGRVGAWLRGLGIAGAAAAPALAGALAGPPRRRGPEPADGGPLVRGGHGGDPHAPPGGPGARPARGPTTAGRAYRTGGSGPGASQRATGVSGRGRSMRDAR